MPRKYDGRHKLTHQDGGIDEITLTGLSGLVGDSQAPLAHKTSHQDGGTDEISLSGLSGQQIIIPKNAKIADITHADTSKHTLDLATALSETRKIIAIISNVNRIAGTGDFNYYPNEGTYKITIVLPFICDVATVILANGTQRVQYSLTTANDDFDMYCLGYVVEA